MESYLWLKNSKTYQSINGDDSEDITEHVKHLCQPVINGPSDVAQILGAIQYWDVYEIPANIILYFATHLICSDDIPFIIEKEWLDLFTKLFYLYNISRCFDDIYVGGKLFETCNNFKSCVRIDIYRVFVSSFCRNVTNKAAESKIEELMKLACCVGNLDCVQFIHNELMTVHQGGVLDKYTSYLAARHRSYMQVACRWSIIGKNVNCLKYALEQHLKDVDSDHFIQYENILITAACCGYLEGLLYIVEHRLRPLIYPLSSEISYILTKSCYYAAENGHLCCLKYLHEKGGLLTESTANAAVEHGHLECLRYLHENNCPWNADLCCLATKNGHLGCLRYLHENGCPWNINIMYSAGVAFRSGHFDCLEYLHKTGFSDNIFGL